MTAAALEVLKSDIRDVRLQDRPSAPLAPGEARLRPDALALTANTVTYAVVGERIGYWRFFPCQDDARGLVPAWGFATCTESRADGMSVGDRFFGCWALAQALTVVVKPASDGFIDIAPRREGLAPLYARYHTAPQGDPDAEARRALLQPLLGTGWLLTDYIGDHDRFGAERAVLSAASSKTSIGLAAGLKQAGMPVTGLTSSGNRAFVEGLGLYDDVLLYDVLPNALARVPSIFVDMAGSAPVRQAVHQALAGGRLVRSIGVGAAHWQQIAAAPDLPDPQPEFFFAPAWSQKRVEDWGGETLLRRMGEGLAARMAESRDWLSVETRPLAALPAAWAEVAEGRQSPSAGVMIDLS